MARPHRFGLTRLVVAIALLVGAVGCGPGGAATPSPVDPAQARVILSATLDAWRAGQPASALASSSPPVRVIDEDWFAGLKLESFEVGTPDHVLGTMLQCPVTLRLRDRAGKAMRRTVAFNVTTGPSPSVIRQD